ncbi:hypothetical protein H8356DRAFT_1024585 [Neocallimastix lanati (nom. inval.)]|nr:hypothetical protein H8356DRAFT_1024585 [Neocallimastix sp. JGI-2020a]
MDDFIFEDLKGDSTLQNLNTVIENENSNFNNSRIANEQNYIEINEINSKKKNKKKKKILKKNETYSNPTENNPIIIDDDVYIDVKSDDSDNNNKVINGNAFDILNKISFNDYMDDDIIKDYIENCKDDVTDDSEESNNEIIKELLDDSEKSNNEIINELLDSAPDNKSEEDEIDFLNSSFAKNIIKSDVGVETEPIEIEMDLIKLLENKLSSESNDSSSDESVELNTESLNSKIDDPHENKGNLMLVTNGNNKNRNNKKKKKKGKKNNKKKDNIVNSKKNDMFIEVESNNIPITEIEKALSKLGKKDLEKKNKINNKISSNSNQINDNDEEDDNNSTDNIDIITLLESGNNNNSNDENVISLDDDDNNNNDDDSDVVIVSDNMSVNTISSTDNDKEIILIDESDGEANDIDNDDDFDDKLNNNIFQSKLGQKKILVSDDDDDFLYEGDFDSGDSTWNLNDGALVEKLKNSKFKNVVNGNQDQLLRLQKKKLQKKELAQKKEYLLQKKENLKKENKKIQKVLKSKKGNRLHTSPQVFKYLKHINITIKEFVTNGFESIPLGNLPSELRKSVGMIAIEYNVKLKTRGSGKRKITNLIRTSRSKIPDNWNSIVETVFSKTEAQRHSNMDVRKRNLDMAKRRGKYHNNNKSKGKSSINKPQLGSKVGENANPISDSNKGFKLLQSMGWTPGESLGTNNTNGIVNPIEVIVRDQSGLGASYFDQGFSQNKSPSSGLGVDDDMDEYEKDILYNNKSSMFSSNKNKKKSKGKGKGFSNDNINLNRKSTRNSNGSNKRNNKIGETGGLENSPYNFVNFQKSSSLFTSD